VPDFERRRRRRSPALLPLVDPASEPPPPLPLPREDALEPADRWERTEPGSEPASDPVSEALLRLVRDDFCLTFKRDPLLPSLLALPSSAPLAPDALLLMLLLLRCPVLLPGSASEPVSHSDSLLSS